MQVLYLYLVGLVNLALGYAGAQWLKRQSMPAGLGKSAAGTAANDRSNRRESAPDQDSKGPAAGDDTESDEQKETIVEATRSVEPEPTAVRSSAEPAASELAEPPTDDTVPEAAEEQTPDDASDKTGDVVPSAETELSAAAGGGNQEPQVAPAKIETAPIEQDQTPAASSVPLVADPPHPDDSQTTGNDVATRPTETDAEVGDEQAAEPEAAEGEDVRIEQSEPPGTDSSPAAEDPVVAASELDGETQLENADQVGTEDVIPAEEFAAKPAPEKLIENQVTEQEPTEDAVETGVHRDADDSIERVLTHLETQANLLRHCSLSLSEPSREAGELRTIVRETEAVTKEVLKAMLDGIDGAENVDGADGTLADRLETYWGEINDCVVQLVTVAIDDENREQAHNQLTKLITELTAANQRAQEELAPVADLGIRTPAPVGAIAATGCGTTGPKDVTRE